MPDMTPDADNPFADWPVERLLHELWRCADARRSLEHQERLLAITARRKGATYWKIGEARGMNMSTQNPAATVKQLLTRWNRGDVVKVDKDEEDRFGQAQQWNR